MSDGTGMPSSAAIFSFAVPPMKNSGARRKRSTLPGSFTLSDIGRVSVFARA